MPFKTQNPLRGKGLGTPLPSTDTSRFAGLRTAFPQNGDTPLHSVPELATQIGVSRLWVKDERARMGLGSFKALGAAYAIACEAQDANARNMAHALQGRTYVTASAGNHGLSLAFGASLFAARAVIFLSATVPQPFARRLEGLGAEVVRAGATYEDSMIAAETAANAKGWTLLSDSTWPGYSRLPMLVMEGYLQLAEESARQLDATPTHLVLQAGVGGLACAVAAFARKTWGDGPSIIVVEPEAAPALREGILAGGVVDTTGPVSAMGRLDCKTASQVALNGLARDADLFVTISETEATNALPVLARHGLNTTASGGAGLAALLADLSLPSDARVWTILSEGPEDG